MGAVYAQQLEKPGSYVLALLKANPSIRYSEQFYDGTDELQDRVAAAMQLDACHVENLAALVDFAVAQLESQGIVSTRQLDATMADGEHDYLIELTDKGRQLLAQPKWRATFRHMDL